VVLALRPAVQRSLLLWLAVVFGGLAVTLGLAAIATGQLFVLLVVAPFAVTAYLMWIQSTGRLRERLRDGARAQEFGEGGTFGAGARRTGGTSARARAARERAERDPFEGDPFEGDPRGPFEERGGPFGGSARDRFGERRRRARGRAGGPTVDDGPTLAEAYDTLGLSPDAEMAEVKAAYREQVKETHPDSGGDEERFKRVNEAYDAIRERAE